MNVAERKSEIRHEMTLRRRAATPEAMAEASRTIRDRLVDLPHWAKAKSLAAFWSLTKEPDVTLAARAWIHTGRRLALPRVEGTNPEAVRFYWVADPESDLQPGTLSIQEPNPNRCPVAEPTEIEWIWVPGVAFDSTGGRLGRGKAYYDVLLSRLAATTIRTGIAFDWQIVDEPLPRENWDQTLDEVLTDQRLLRARG